MIDATGIFIASIMAGALSLIAGFGLGYALGLGRGTARERKRIGDRLWAELQFDQEDQNDA